MLTMKATIDVPEELYRQVKARSALEGRAVREITSELFRMYVEGRLASPGGELQRVPAAASESELPEWVGLARKLVAPEAPHAWPAIRASIEGGWAEEVAEPGPAAAASARSRPRTKKRSPRR